MTNAERSIPTTRVALVRHGETDWNVDGRLQGSSDIPLNDVGRAQARRAATALGTARWDDLVSSPLSRASETADIIGRAIGMDRTVEYDDLAERHFGHAEGLSGWEAGAYWPDGRFPGSESPEDLEARGRHRLDRLARDHPGRSIIAVAHGGIIRAILESVTGYPAPRIANAGVALLDHDDRGWMVQSINSVPVARRWHRPRR